MGSVFLRLVTCREDYRFVRFVQAVDDNLDIFKFINNLTLESDNSNTGHWIRILTIHSASTRRHSNIRLSHTDTFSTGNRMSALVANSINVLDRAEAVSSLTVGPISDDRFGTVRSWMSWHLTIYNLQHCQIGHQKPDEWLVGQTSDVLICSNAWNRIGGWWDLARGGHQCLLSFSINPWELNSFQCGGLYCISVSEAPLTAASWTSSRRTITPGHHLSVGIPNNVSANQIMNTFKSN